MHQEQENWNLESAPVNTTIRNCGKKFLAQKNKPGLSQYLHAALFSPKMESLIKATKQGFLKTWTGLT